VELQAYETKKNKVQILEFFEFQMFSKADFYCIDGFPTEGMPGVVVIPPPLRGGYVY